MKTLLKIFFSFAFLFIIVNAFTQSDEAIKPEYTSTLKVSPIQFGSSYFEISYEKFFSNNKRSIHISPMIMLKQNSYEEFKGIQLELQYRLYLKQLNKEENATWVFSDIDLYSGFYANGLTYTENYNMGYYEYDPITMREEYKDGNFDKDINGGEGGVFVGLQFTLAKRIVIDVLAGGGIRYSDVVDEYVPPENQYYYNDYGVFDLEYLGVKPKLNIQIGITL